ncbi:hypothetical protein [Streptomyces sp. MZ04]|uniref:hypothetical protein n=1 Tax=Streptomyces sp. MZ04 TaxID=2559236 RepID=UPI00107EB688|nr:hypothetical protein [Streptomyces sp. MZ04]TGB16096.1 hypothetical protein E2651_01290 [Streptomyces sp. MZ04]
MSVRKRLAGGAAAVAIAGAGVVAAPATASAAPATVQGALCYANDVTGSLGHNGKSIYCEDMSQYFYGAILCHKVDGSNYNYWHYGPVVGPNGASTVWCDYGAVVIEWRAYFA